MGCGKYLHSHRECFEGAGCAQAVIPKLALSRAAPAISVLLTHPGAGGGAGGSATTTVQPATQRPRQAGRMPRVQGRQQSLTAPTL